MSFQSAPYQPITDAAIEQARRETQERDQSGPRIQAARFEPETGHLVLEMQNGASVRTPARSLQALADAADEQLGDVRVVSNGNALHWDALDVQMTTVALVKLIFRITTMNDVARRAGRVTSPAKAAAARANGRKGGRPPKKTMTAA